MALRVFVDTNTFLEFQPLEQIDWQKLLEEKGEIELCVSIVVIRELDNHKSDGSKRTRRRAQAAISRLKELKSNPVVRSGVQVRLILKEPDPKTFDANALDRTVADDRLLACVLDDKANGATVAVASGDYGVQLKAEAAQLRVCELPDDLRLAGEADPAEEENRSLRKKLAAVTRPEAILSLVPGDGASFVAIRLSPNKIDIEERMQQLKDVTPALSRVLLGGQLLSDFSDKNGPRYRERYRGYLKELELYRVSTELRLCVRNEGLGTADDVDVWMAFPEGVEILRKALVEPKPPPSPRPFEMHDPFETVLIADELITNFTIEPQADKTTFVHYHFRSVKQSNAAALEPLVIRIHDEQSFAIEYKIHARDQKESEGKLNVRVTSDR